MLQLKKLFLALSMTCVAAGPAFSAEQYLRIGTASVGSGFYMIGNTIAQLGQNAMKDHVFSAVTGSSNKSCITLEKRELEFAVIGSPNFSAAWAGSAPFKQPMSHLRYVTTLYPMAAHIMVGTKSGIKSISDFKGKHIDFANVGSNVEMSTRQAIPFWGVQEKDFTVERFGRSEFDEAFKNGRIDGHIWSTTFPNAQIADLIRLKAATLITPEPDKVKALIEKYPHYIPFTIPGGTYAGLPNDIHTFAPVGALITHDGMSEELVYQVTKMLHENTAFLKGRLSNYFADFDLKLALLGRGQIPLHPGAARYYREKGLL
ncbi:TAXI family TRAP transporter solute-binding subunit [Oleispirillum naphthae]|uniref:TAXI family TRAP transporter solute-binding subunit n=1 Tax=Oleispirillum naphthae TaxID=2838853 RepID=UPI00308257F6